MNKSNGFLMILWFLLLVNTCLAELKFEVNKKLLGDYDNSNTRELLETNATDLSARWIGGDYASKQGNLPDAELSSIGSDNGFKGQLLNTGDYQKSMQDRNDNYLELMAREDTTKIDPKEVYEINSQGWDDARKLAENERDIRRATEASYQASRFEALRQAKIQEKLGPEFLKISMLLNNKKKIELYSRLLGFIAPKAYAGFDVEKKAEAGRKKFNEFTKSCKNEFEKKERSTKNKAQKARYRADKKKCVEQVKKFFKITLGNLLTGKEIYDLCYEIFVTAGDTNDQKADRLEALWGELVKSFEKIRAIIEEMPAGETKKKVRTYVQKEYKKMKGKFKKITQYVANKKSRFAGDPKKRAKRKAYQEMLKQQLLDVGRGLISYNPNRKKSIISDIFISSAHADFMSSMNALPQAFFGISGSYDTLMNKTVFKPLERSVLHGSLAKRSSLGAEINEDVRRKTEDRRNKLDSIRDSFKRPTSFIPYKKIINKIVKTLNKIFVNDIFAEDKIRKSNYRPIKNFPCFYNDCSSVKTNLRKMAVRHNFDSEMTTFVQLVGETNDYVTKSKRLDEKAMGMYRKIGSYNERFKKKSLRLENEINSLRVQRGKNSIDFKTKRKTLLGLFKSKAQKIWKKLGLVKYFKKSVNKFVKKRGFSKLKKSSSLKKSQKLDQSGQTDHEARKNGSMHAQEKKYREYMRSKYGPDIYLGSEINNNYKVLEKLDTHRMDIEADREQSIFELISKRYFKSMAAPLSGK